MTIKGRHHVEQGIREATIGRDGIMEKGEVGIEESGLPRQAPRRD